MAFHLTKSALFSNHQFCGKLRIEGISPATLNLHNPMRTYRTKADLDEIEANDKQLRLGPKIDEELRRQSKANSGLFEPLLVEPHPDLAKKFRIIDGDRRWSNSHALLKQG